MSLLLSETLANPTTALFSANPLTAGIATGLTWAASGALYTAFIPVPGLKYTSVVLAIVSGGTPTDLAAVHIDSCFGSTISGGGISIFSSGQPATPASFSVNWLVAKF